MPKIELEILQDLTPLKVGLQETINNLRVSSAALGKDMQQAFNTSEQQARSFDTQLKNSVHDMAALEKQTQQTAIKAKTSFDAYRDATGTINKLIAREQALLDARNKSNNSKSIERFNQLIEKNRKEYEKLTKATNEQAKATDKLSKQSSSLGSSISGLVTGISIAAIGKEIIQTTAEFQKFEAVLTNALGSKSLAKQALDDIATFAAKTPFSVQELTGSYVKLVNQGFIPTTQELTKLGDLAASTGKTFDQLSEAIIDAQTGEFERLKEFGIRASKEGDKVNFTFKGVKKQVDFTAESIQNYVLSLGDAKGVSGSMAAISETLGGAISNLGDQWDSTMNTIGESTTGASVTAIKALSLLLEGVKGLFEYLGGPATKVNTDVITTNLQLSQTFEKLGFKGEAAAEKIQQVAKALNAAGVSVNDIGIEEQLAVESFAKAANSYSNLYRLITKNSTAEQNQSVLLAFENAAKDLKKQNDEGSISLEEYTIKLRLLSNEYQKAKDTIGLFGGGTATVTGIVKKLKDEIEGLRKEQDAATSKEQLSKINKTLAEKEKELNDLLGKSSEERKKKVEDFAKQLLDLTNRAQKAELELLYNSDKVALQQKISESELQLLREKLLKQGRETDKNFKFTELQEQQFAIILKEIRTKSAKDALDIEVNLQSKIQQQRVKTQQEAVNSLEQERALRLAQIDQIAVPKGIDEAEFERQKRLKILAVEEDYASKSLEVKTKELDAKFEAEKVALEAEIKLVEERYDLEALIIKQNATTNIAQLTSNTEKEKTILVEQTKATINQIKIERDRLVAQKQFSIKDLLGLSDSEMQNLKTAFDGAKTLANNLLNQQVQISEKQISDSQRKQDQYQNEINSLESKYQAEYQLAAVGKANNINRINEEIAAKKQAADREAEIEKKAMERKRELQRQQLIIDSIAEASQLTVSSANIFASATSTAGPLGVPIALLAIGAMIAGFTASKIQAFKAVNEGFADGGYTGDGGKYDEAGTVHKGEFVITKEETSKHRKFLEGWHKNDEMLMKQGLQELLKSKGIVLESDLPKKINRTRDNILQAQNLNLNSDYSTLEKKLDEQIALNEKTVELLKQQQYQNQNGDLVIKNGTHKTVIKK